jgi:hydroxymethylglutaryl-CoA lyase
MSVMAMAPQVQPPPDVEVVEVSPRDGLQNEALTLSVATRVELIARCVAAGVRRIETASFVNPARVPQMAGAEEVVAALPRLPDVSYIGLVLNRRGLERALAAGVDEVNAVVFASETFSRRNQGVSIREAIATWEDVARDAHAANVRASVTVSASFGCPFEGEVPADRVVEIVRRVSAAGPDEVALADTIGVGVPAQVHALVHAARRVAPEVRLRAHFHNTRNTGYANALAAVDAGVGVLDASAGGLGGCPFAPNATGNIATEDLVYALDRSGRRTGIDLTRIAAVGMWLGQQLGKDEVPALLGRAGPFPPERGDD